MNKKSALVISLIGVLAMATMASVVVSLNSSADFTTGASATAKAYIELDNTNAPNEATDEYATFTHSFGNVTLRYGSAKRAADGHIVLKKGGYIEKIDESKSLLSAQVSYSGGAVYFQTSYFGETDSYFKTYPESGSEFEISGNRWRLVAEGDDIVLNSLTVSYGCEEMAWASGYSESTLAHPSSMSEAFLANYVTVNENKDVIFSFKAEVTGSYKTDRLLPGHLKLFNSTDVIDCYLIEYRTQTVIEAYFNLSTWIEGKNGNFTFHPHLKIDGNIVGANDSGDVRSPTMIDLPSTQPTKTGNGDISFGQDNWVAVWMFNFSVNRTVQVKSKGDNLDGTDQDGLDKDFKVKLQLSESSDDHLAPSSFVLKDEDVLKHEERSVTAYNVEFTNKSEKWVEISFHVFDIYKFWKDGARNDDGDVAGFLFYMHLYINGSPYDGDVGNLKTKWSNEQPSWTVHHGSDGYDNHWVRNYNNEDVGDANSVLYSAYNMLVMKIFPRSRS